MKKYILFLLVICSSNAIAQQINSSPNQGKIEQLQTDYSKIADSNSSLKNKVGVLEDSLKAQALLLNSLQEELIADVSAIKQDLNKLNNENRKVRNTISQEAEKLSELISVQEAKIDSLEKLTNQNSRSISKTAEELGIRIQETGDFSEQKYASLGNALSQNKVYGFSAVFAVALLTIIGFVLLRRRAGSDKTQLVLQIQDTKEQLAEEGIKLDSKLVEILETQLKLLSEERVSTSITPEEADHSLALKVADEIARIQMNLGHMDSKTKGLKQLARAVNSIIDNFQANGYETPELLNRPYDQGMNLVATLEPDSSLNSGQQIIKRIVKPQVNYKGVMIQAAQVVVAYGE